MLIEAPDGSDATEQMEAMAERLTSDMAGSGLFKYARYGLREDELLKMVRLFAWNFPIFLQPGQWQEVRDRLNPAKVRQTIRAGWRGTGYAVLSSWNRLLRYRSVWALCR